MALGAEMLNHFLDAFREFPDRGDASQARARAAVESVMAAARQTQTYLTAARGRAGADDRVAELDLIDLWHDAALHLERVDVDLSQICLTSAQFWSHPRNWSPEEFDAVLHTAREVCDEARQRLEESG